MKLPKLALASDSLPPRMTLAVVNSHYSAREISEMASVFVRSEEVHQHSMDMISANLTDTEAVEVLQNSSLGNATGMPQVMGLILGNKQLRAQSLQVAKGFGGVDGARKLLNEMIHE